MSKKLIAGAGVVASLAVALAPLATFATGQNTDRTVVDKLEVTIESSCAFGHNFTGNITDLDGVVRTDGDAAWAGNTSSTDDPKSGIGTFSGDPVKSEDTASKIMEAGTATNNFATTALTVYCNNGRGYTISAVGTDLEVTTVTTSAGAAAHPIKAAAGASSVTGAGDWTAQNPTTSKWSWKPTLDATSNAALNTTGGITSGSELAAPASATTIVSGTSSTQNTGDVLTVVYSVGLVTNQDAGTYTGTMTYTLAEVAAS